MGPGGEISIIGDKLKISNSQIDNTNQNIDSESINESIGEYCSDELNDQNRLTLALSGGIDSRLILSSLLNREQKFECYSLQNGENNDIKIAEEMCKQLNLAHTLLPRKEIHLDELESKILHYYKSIPPVIPLSQLMDFLIFGTEYLKGKIIIDGGFGGFYRRQYFNRIYFQGYKNFNTDHSSLYSKLFYAPKPDIFNGEFSTALTENYQNEISNLIAEFKNPGNWEELSQILDTISVRYMLPSIYGAGQTLLDQELISIMPLVQKKPVQIGLNLSVKKKIGSKLFKGMISQNYPLLAKFNLVNNNLISYFGTNYKLFRLRLLIHNRMFKKRNNSRYHFIQYSKDYVQDLFNSTQIRNDEYFNNSKIIAHINDFYSGKNENYAFMDWLLTYALWRKANK